MPEGLWEAELYRLKARCLLQMPDSRVGASHKAEGQACFARVLEVSRRQNAKALEARVVQDLRPSGERPRRTPGARFV